MARTRKAATARKSARKAKRKSTTRKSAKRAAAKRRPARKVARKRARKAAKPRSLGGRIVQAADLVLDTLSEAERLHTRTTRKAGFQELE